MHLCNAIDPNSEYECPHSCGRNRGHAGPHAVTFTWPRDDDEEAES